MQKKRLHKQRNTIPSKKRINWLHLFSIISIVAVLIFIVSFAAIKLANKKISRRGVDLAGQATDTISGSCQAICGSYYYSGDPISNNVGCSCDELCTSYGDCCSDYPLQCVSRDIGWTIPMNSWSLSVYPGNANNKGEKRANSLYSKSNGQRVLWNIWQDDLQISPKMVMEVKFKTSTDYTPNKAYYRIFFKDNQGKSLEGPYFKLPNTKSQTQIITKEVNVPAGAVKIYASYLDFEAGGRGEIEFFGATYSKIASFNPGIISLYSYSEDITAEGTVSTNTAKVADLADNGQYAFDSAKEYFLNFYGPASTETSKRIAGTEEKWLRLKLNKNNNVFSDYIFKIGGTQIDDWELPLDESGSYNLQIYECPNNVISDIDWSTHPFFQYEPEGYYTDSLDLQHLDTDYSTIGKYAEACAAKLADIQFSATANQAATYGIKGADTSEEDCTLDGNLALLLQAYDGYSITAWTKGIGDDVAMQAPTYGWKGQAYLSGEFTQSIWNPLAPNHDCNNNAPRDYNFNPKRAPMDPAVSKDLDECNLISAYNMLMNEKDLLLTYQHLKDEHMTVPTQLSYATLSSTNPAVFDNCFKPGIDLNQAYEDCLGIFPKGKCKEATDGFLDTLIEQQKVRIDSMFYQFVQQGLIGYKNTGPENHAGGLSAKIAGLKARGTNTALSYKQSTFAHLSAGELEAAKFKTLDYLKDAYGLSKSYYGYKDFKASVDAPSFQNFGFFFDPGSGGISLSTDPPEGWTEMGGACAGITDMLQKFFQNAEFGNGGERDCNKLGEITASVYRTTEAGLASRSYVRYPLGWSDFNMMAQDCTSDEIKRLMALRQIENRHGNLAQFSHITNIGDTTWQYSELLSKLAAGFTADTSIYYRGMVSHSILTTKLSGNNFEDFDSNHPQELSRIQANIGDDYLFHYEHRFFDITWPINLINSRSDGVMRLHTQNCDCAKMCGDSTEDKTLNNGHSWDSVPTC